MNVKGNLIFILCLFAFQCAQAQSPGSQVMVVLAGSGAQSGTITYEDGRVDTITNQITIQMQFHPYSPQNNGNLFSSTLADFNGSITIQSSDTETLGGSSNSQYNQKTVTYTNYTDFTTDTEFFSANGNMASLSLALLNPNTISSDDMEPYELFYDGTNQVLTVWIRLPSPFIYPDWKSVV